MAGEYTGCSPFNRALLVVGLFTTGLLRLLVLDQDVGLPRPDK